MAKQHETKIIVIASVVFLTVCIGHLLIRGSKSRQSLSPQQQLIFSPSTHVPSPTSRQKELPDLLRITPSARAATQLHPFQKTVSNPAVVQRLYSAILALPPAPTGIQLCPFDTGVEFSLNFYSENDLILQVTAHPGGCRFVVVTGSYTRSTNNDFWGLLAKTMGVSESSLVAL